MLSGVGPSEHLKDHGIEVIHDLPGVGEHLVDHPTVDVCFRDKFNVSPKHIKPQSLVEGVKMLGSLVQYLMTRNGALTSNVSAWVDHTRFSQICLVRRMCCICSNG